MPRSFLVALALIAGAGVLRPAVRAQAKPASAGHPGGAYYEFMMGMQLEMQGDAAGASAAYQRAERLDPQSAEVPAALAELYARMNRPNDAIAAGERAVKANPSSAEANWILGNLYARMSEMANTNDKDRLGYVQRAVERLERADHNAHPGVTVMLGRLYLAGHDFEKAVTLLAPFVNSEPDQLEAVALLSEAYQATGREALAVALLERSVEESPELYGTLALVYERSERWSDAARAYQGAVQDRPENAALRAQWATALLNAGEPKRAREVLEEVSGNLRNARTLYLLAEAQRRLRDFTAAEATARRLTALDPKALGGPRELALIFRDQDEHQKIVTLLEPIVTTRLRSADAGDMSSDAFRNLYFDLVSAYEALKQFDKAIAVMVQARTLSPTDPRVDIRLARAQMNAGKGDNAIETMRSAVTKFPEQAGVTLELASMLERERKHTDADALFRQVIAADPKNADALNSFGKYAGRAGPTPRRIGVARRARVGDRSGQSRVPRQPRLGVLQTESIRSGGASPQRGGQAASVGVGHPKPLRRSPEQTRAVSGSHRRLGARASGGRRGRHPFGARREDQVRPPAPQEKAVSHPACCHAGRSPSASS